jgi:Ser/Thr protein kinase RdoA (MazF antagonist)
MHTPLADNAAHLRELCARLRLGEPLEDLQPVTGGLHHRMWRLRTGDGRFAIKQLSHDTDLENPETRAHFNATEATAEAFAVQGIPAVFALGVNSEYLQVLDGIGYLVHPWRDASGVPLGRVSERHAVEVAGILARMHALALDSPLPRRQGYDIPLEDNIELLVDFAQGFHIKLADTLQRALPSFREIARSQPDAIAVLDSCRVVSHGDMDQKNILWDADGGPWLIDWESARWLNPGYEALLQALNWSGITGHFSPEVFSAFLNAYTQAGGDIDGHQLGAAYQCVRCDWLNWLMYNVGRCMDLEEPEQRATGQQQVALALATLQHVMDRVPGLLGLPDTLSVGEA